MNLLSFIQNRRLFWLSVCSAVIFLAGGSSLQSQTVLDLPRPSQSASVSQRVGITDIAIHYSRPLVKNRKLWGGLVPYDQVWRAGANENTTISISDQVKIESELLPAGTYGLHMIPHERDCTIIFSKTSSSWGSFTYDPSEDALRVTVKTSPSDFHEALTYELDELRPSSVVVTLRWERLAISFKVSVDLNQTVSRSLEKQLRAWPRWMWQPWDEAATYLLGNHGDMQTALEDADHSIRLEERFENWFTKSQILNALHRDTEASAARTKALSFATAQQLHNYGMGLMSEGRPDEAFEIFKLNIQSHPDTLIAHIELARIASGRGDFDTAIKEINAAMKLAPDATKRNLENLLRRLRNREDINK